MPQIFKLFSKSRKTLFLIGVGLVLLLIPFEFIEAQLVAPWAGCFLLDFWCYWDTFGNWILTLPVRLPFFLIALIFGLVALVAGVIFSVIISLLNWIITISLTIPITQGGIVDVGWTFTRDFANLLFILVLIFIGLATILKLREYEARKTLPKLILVALLINFTPVIVGFIVDVANIFTNFFFTRAASFVPLADVFNEAWQYLESSFNTILYIDSQFYARLLEDYNTSPAILGVFIGIIVYGAVLIVFYALASLVYLVVFILLFARILFLWILMILAPIAFFSQVLPPSRTIKALFPSILYWDEWWEKLIQWSIIGIPLGLFLYLSNWMIQNQSAIDAMLNPWGASIGDITASTATGGIMTIGLASGVGIIANILTPLAALAFLWFGTIVSIQAAPAGARQIINYAKRGGMAVAAFGPARRGLGRLAGGTAKGLGAIAPAMRRLEQFAEKAPKGKYWAKPAVAFVTRPAGLVFRGISRAAGPTLLRYAARAREFRVPSEFDDMSSHEQADVIKTLLAPGERADQLKLIARMSKLDTLKFEPEIQEMAGEYAKRFAKSPYYKKEVAQIMDNLPEKITQEVAIDFEVGKEAKDKMRNKISELAKEISVDVELKPEIAKIAKKRGVTEDQAAKDIAAGAIHVSEQKPGDVPKIIKGSLKSLAIRLGTQEWTSRHLGRLKDTFDKETVKDVFEGVGGLNAIIKNREDLEKFYWKNPRLLRFFAVTPAGREWGWKGMEYMPKTKEGRPDFGAFEIAMSKKKPPSPLPPTQAKISQWIPPPPPPGTPPPGPPPGKPPSGPPPGTPPPGTKPSSKKQPGKPPGTP